MHTQAYSAGMQAGATHEHKISPQHSYSWAHRQVEQNTTGKDSRQYAYWQGYADALKARMPVGSGIVQSHTVSPSSTMRDKGRLSPSQISRLADTSLESSTALHNKRIISPERHKPISIHAIDVVHVPGTRQFVSVISVKVGKEKPETTERHRQEALDYAKTLADIGEATYNNLSSGRQGSRMGGNEVEKGRR